MHKYKLKEGEGGRELIIRRWWVIICKFIIELCLCLYTSIFL